MEKAKRPRFGGRQKGTPNKTTAMLKEAILEAARLNGGGKAGLVKYLEKQAKDNPVAFLSLLGKVLPLQVTGEDGGPLQVVVQKFSDTT